MLLSLRFFRSFRFGPGYLITFTLLLPGYLGPWGLGSWGLGALGGGTIWRSRKSVLEQPSITFWCLEFIPGFRGFRGFPGFPGNGGMDCCSDPPFTRAGGQDDGS